MKIEQSENFYSKKSTLYGTAVLLFLILCLAYSNHFNNGFKFDDYHTIVYNDYIKDIKNIPAFFTDIKYFGTTPGNQGYRPMLPTLCAIDYWIAGGLKPVYMHADIFFFYLVQLVLMFFMFRKILDRTLPSEKNQFFSLLIVGFYALHASNAEVINYMCQRTDAFSTLCIIASFVLYMTPITKKYYLYLVTALMGVLTKETGAMFGPMLFFYILIIEEEVSLVDLILFKKLKSTINAVIKSLPGMIFSMGVLILIQYMLGHTKVLGSQPEGPNVQLPNSPFKGFMTQWVVTMHYLGNFILPVDLSGEPDIKAYTNFFDIKVLFSLMALIVLHAIAIFTSIRKKYLPISFGIIWFFLALFPTSFAYSLSPVGQLSNDHRTFFPFVGLAISLGWWLRLLYLKYEHHFNKYGKYGLGILYSLIISLHAYGTYQRNIVWSTELSLWEDSIKKSPKSFNSQMNYGVALMAKARYDEALVHFRKALEIQPNHSYIQINMAIALAGTGNTTEAEQYFKTALSREPTMPEVYYYYAKWLSTQNRIEESLTLLEKGHEISPQDGPINELLPIVLAAKGTKEEQIKKLEEQADKNPTSANYINLSLLYYKDGSYQKCIEACEKALKIDPKSALAYNNICSAYNALEKWDKAADACNKAIRINPDYQVAKNNLANALNKKSANDIGETDAKQHPTPEKYLNLSVKYYNQAKYEKCIEAANNAIKLKPDFSQAYNNIGLSYAKLNEFDKAIEAYKKSLAIDPNNTYAKNNMAATLKQKNGK